jgi:hypothetical protein
MKRTILVATFFVTVMLSLATSALMNNRAANGGAGAIAAAPAVNPHAPATVTMSFDGLIAVCFGDPTRVSAGFLNVAHHSPNITITKVENGQQSTIAVLKDQELSDTLYLDIEGSESGVRTYQTDSSDEKDFRWNIDLESDIHQRQLYIKEEKLLGKLHISTGLFYADHLSEKPVRFFAADNSGNMLPFNRRIGEPAGKINMNSGDALVLKSKKVNLRLVSTPGISYEISITNLPPANMASMNHWLFYYDFINADVKHYAPVMINKAAYAPRPMICTAAVFSKSRLQ